MGETQPPPGMSHSEWKYREGRALRAHGLETDDSEMAAEGLEKSVNALEESARSGVERIFSELFPGEDIPEDSWELRRKVDREILTPEEFEEIYKYDDED